MSEIREFKDAILARSVIGRFVEAREFGTEEARKQYLHDHPDADPKNHTVKKHEESAPKEEKPAEDKGQKPADAPKGKMTPEQKAATAPKGLSIKEPPAKGLFHPEEMNLQKEIIQPVYTPEKLFAAADQAHEASVSWLNQGKGIDKVIGAKVFRKDKEGGPDPDYSQPGPVIVIGSKKNGSEKGKKRCAEKVELAGGDWTSLGDIVRASIAVDNMDQVADVLKTLRKSGMKLARKPKDRFANPPDAGYRDMLLSVVYPNGHVGEVQLHLKPMLEAKAKGHHIYESVRGFVEDCEKTGRDMTPEEANKLAEANKKQRAIYDPVWQAAMGKKDAPAEVKTAVRKAMEKDAETNKEALSSNVLYYEYGDLPAYFKTPKLPRLVTAKGEKMLGDMEKFFREANKISEKEFKEMCENIGAKVPAL